MNGDVLEDHKQLNGYIPSPIKFVPELDELSEPTEASTQISFHPKPAAEEQDEEDGEELKEVEVEKPKEKEGEKQKEEPIAQVPQKVEMQEQTEAAPKVEVEDVKPLEVNRQAMSEVTAEV